MKIWIDLTNSPHINFFSNIIEDIQSRGHEVIITCRDLANTIELIQLKGWEYKEIGRHAGARTLNKLSYFPKRVLQLYLFLRKNKPDVAVSHSSFYSPITSWLLKIPSIYINDNEHAKGNYISFLFASKVLLPEFLENVSKQKKWKNLSKIFFYPGTKEAVYLSKGNFGSGKNITKEKIKNIYIRPEPWTAQYYKGRKFFMDGLIIELSKYFNVFILPRGKEQQEHYEQKFFSTINVIGEAISLENIIDNCDLFIGAGGTMTREVAILGIPTISIYQDQLLEVDKFLIKNNYMFHEQNLTLEKVIDIVEKWKRHESNDLMQKGKEAHKMLINTILNI